MQATNYLCQPLAEMQAWIISCASRSVYHPAWRGWGSAASSSWCEGDRPPVAAGRSGQQREPGLGYRHPTPSQLWNTTVTVVTSGHLTRSCHTTHHPTIKSKTVFYLRTGAFYQEASMDKSHLKAYWRKIRKASLLTYHTIIISSIRRPLTFHLSISTLSG